MTLGCCDNALKVLDLEENLPDCSEVGLKKHSIRMIVERYNNLIKDKDACRPHLIWAKNRLLFQIMMNESKDYIGDTYFKKFDIKLFNDKICKACKGTGFHPVWGIGVIKRMDKCFDCLGYGLASKQCDLCSGKGSIKGVKCKKCKGKTKLILKPKRFCPRCKGSKFLDRKVTTDEITSFKSCSMCIGLGYVDK